MTGEDVVAAVASVLVAGAVGFLGLVGTLGVWHWIEDRRRERASRAAEAYAWRYGLLRRRGESSEELCGRIVQVIDLKRAKRENRCGFCGSVTARPTRACSLCKGHEAVA